MSAEDLTAFFGRLETDEVLQEKARPLGGLADDARIEGLCALAAELGFAVTPDDVRAAAAGSGAASLDDEELRRVVGAGGVSCSAPGFVADAPRQNESMRG